MAGETGLATAAHWARSKIKDHAAIGGAGIKVVTGHAEESAGLPVVVLQPIFAQDRRSSGIRVVKTDVTLQIDVYVEGRDYGTLEEIAAAITAALEFTTEVAPQIHEGLRVYSCVRESQRTLPGHEASERVTTRLSMDLRVCVGPAA